MMASLGLTALFAASACATQPAAPTPWEAAEAEIARCFDAMDRDPALGAVNAKYARRSPTAAQLADGRRATEEEAEQLRLRIRRTRPCRELRLAAVRAHRPLFEPAYRVLYYQADQVFDYLINRALSYGAANELSRASLAAFQNREREFESAASDAERRALSDTWDEQLQRGHSNPPQDDSSLTCVWSELNISCRQK